jgi:hypothetical protein
MLIPIRIVLWHEILVEFREPTDPQCSRQWRKPPSIRKHLCTATNAETLPHLPSEAMLEARRSEPVPVKSASKQRE